MFSQDENPVSDASTTRRILTPISETSLNGSDGLGSGGKKRKRDGNTMEDLLKASFVVKVSIALPQIALVDIGTALPLASFWQISDSTTPSPASSIQSTIVGSRYCILFQSFAPVTAIRDPR
jgi:hypothetical protein